MQTAPESVRYISYSTCSIYREEDECVVNDLLNKHYEHWELSPNFAEAVKKCLQLKKEDRGNKKMSEKVESLLEGIHISEEGLGARLCPMCSKF
mmetsp:Transcript_14701/g.25023  ORF Transcript_14701/g.25023 Transcript_14701/m.25023 type:complete len:94 (+) Transcript_14701:1120-1401(+)